MVHHLQHLLFYGADMNARNASGNTPLHVCAVNNQVTASQKSGRGIAGIMEMRALELQMIHWFSQSRRGPLLGESAYYKQGSE